MEFPTRKGTSNPGLNYEKEIAALFAIRYSFEASVQDFWIATNVDCIGDTDDVVLCITPVSGEKLALLLQLKHENPSIGNAKNLQETDFTYRMNVKKRRKSKENFSVEKYSRGYENFQNRLSNTEQEQPELIQLLREINKYAYILYTNKGLEEKLNCLVNVDENAIFNHLNTSQHTFYGFKTEDFHFDEDFLQNLYLFPNQVNSEAVFNLIKAEIRKLFGSHKFVHVDFDHVTKRYLEVIKLWTKGCEFENKTKYIALYKRDIINILSDILLGSYKCVIEKSRFSYYDCPQKNIWNKLMFLKNISIVYGDDLTLPFLKDYIGTEVKENTKKQGRNWKTEIAKFASNALREPIPKDQVQMMKICNNTSNGCITMVSVYKYMWFYRNLPLLLEIKDDKEYEDVLKILKISKYHLKVIVIITDRDLVCRKINKVNHFSSLKDLEPTDRAEILNLSVQFQGRIPIPLSQLAQPDMLQHLKCTDIIHILCNNFNVGNKVEFNCKNYINRTVSKILISFKALVEIQNEYFLIEAHNKKTCEQILTQKLSTFNFKLGNNSQILILELDDNSQNMKELKKGHDRIHRLLFHEDFLEWKESTGSVSSIARFQISSNILDDNVKSFVNSLDTNKFQIISACPGMGKSMLLNYIVCFATSCVWILSITLRKIAENHEMEEKPSEFFRFYLDKLLSEDSSIQNLPFSLMVFQEMVKSKKVLLLLDGFDEIAILHKDKFSNFIAYLQQEKYPVLITTRENMKGFLENNFGTLSKKLKLFTLDEQRRFLTEFFKLNILVNHEQTNTILVDFVEQLLDAAKLNLNDRDEKFVGVPLQLQLLANNFLAECKMSLDTKQVCLTKNFDLLDLYDGFIKNKTKILCEKYGPSEKHWLKSIETNQQLFALYYLFESGHLKELNIENRLKEFFEEEEEYKAQLMQKEGILVAKPSANDEIGIDFIHRTFAEFLAAQWLTKNVKTSKFKETVAQLVNLRFEELEYYKFLFVIFDRILAKHCTFHLDIINVKVDDIRSKLEKNSKIWVETDETNRTAFHMFGLYANDFKEDDLNGILDVCLLKDLELDALDNLIGYSALDYALLTGSWFFANKLCELSRYLVMKNYALGSSLIMKLSLKYEFLYLTIFHNYLCRDFLLGNIDEDTKIIEYSVQLSNNNFLPQYIYDIAESTSTVGEYLKFCGIKDNDEHNYRDVRFAISFGSIENIQNLLSAEVININERDTSNKCTLLHYATIHQRSDVIKLLLSRGAEVNTPGRNGSTVVHEVAHIGRNDILELYIDNDANLSVEDNFHRTPLDIAMLRKSSDVVETLLEHSISGGDNPGFDYEKQITALLALRYAFEESVQDFWIATNVKDVGDTDDVVLCITPTEGEDLAILLQLKHENPTGDGKKFENSDFTYLMNVKKRDTAKERYSVEKYYKGYKKFQYNLQNAEKEEKDLIKHLRKVKHFTYILYTNKCVDKELTCLKDTSENLMLNHLNTSKSVVYGFNSENFKKCEEEDFLQNLEKFLQNFYLFPNQISIGGLFNLIKAEIKQLFGSHKFSLVDFDDVTTRYLEIIEQWTKGCEFGKKKKFMTLSKTDFVNILSDILLEAYKYNIEKFPFSDYDCPQKNIWNEVMRLKDVSVVYGDDLALKFLRDYIGTEVKLNTKKRGRYWKTDVSKLACNAFCEPISDNQVQIMKMCGNANNDNITMVDIYKFMWFYKNLPLLLEINDKEEYKDIVKILKISQYKLKVILISTDREMVCQKMDEVNYFASLKDLEPAETVELKTQILNLTVQLQGRIPIPLSELAKTDMLKHLKCVDIIHILCNMFNVGNKVEFGCSHYINRSLSKILISFEALAEIENEFFLIETQDVEECERVLSEKLATFGFEINNNPQICILESKSIPRKFEKLKTSEDCVHLLLFHEGLLEWKKSTESVANITRYQIIDRNNSSNVFYDDVTSFLKSVDSSKFQIVSACPGMGKSILLDYITCFATSCAWILPVTLRSIADNDEIEEEPAEFFRIYMEDILSEDSSVQNMDFSLVVFKDMLKKKKVLLLLDGFDEVSILHKDKFSNFIDYLQKEKYPVMITTRENMKSFMENKFNILSKRLKSFTLEEQKQFLTNFFKAKVTIMNEDSNAVLLDFVEQLLNAAKHNLNDRDEEFTGIPLQLELLANNFLKECMESITTKQVCLSTRFDLLDLYDKFITNKTKILCDKYGKGEKQWLKSLESDQQLFALQYLFEDRHLKELNIENRMEQYYEDEEYKAQLIQKEGILIARPTKTKINIDFIHLTFAEYLAALWLTKDVNITKSRGTVARLVKLRFEEPDYYKFLFAVFDRILAKHCTIHLDIINVNVDGLKKHFDSDPNVFEKSDKLNRTGFHIFGLYANDYKEEDLIKILDTGRMKNKKVDALDNLIGYNALDYALFNKFWTFANILCELSRYLDIRHFELDYRPIENLSLKYKFLYLTVFHNHVCRDVLIADINEDTQILDYARQLYNNIYLSKDVFDLVNSVSTIGEYLKLCGIKDSSNYYYNDIRFAIAFGSKKNVELLLCGEELDINAKDSSNGQTLLHYATIYKREDVVKILLSKGADVNITGRNGANAVHFAVSAGCNSILEMYIDQKANLNLENNSLEAPLDVAIQRKHLNAAKILLKHDAKIAHSFHILHKVVVLGDIELLQDFLQKGYDVNEKFFNGKSPLHIALERNRVDMARILIDHNCDFKSDTASDSLMHLTAKIGNIELLHLFLDGGLDIDKHNQIGETPLMIAINNGHVDFAKILISNNADVHAKCKYGDVLSIAISKGSEEVISELINAGCEINRRDGRGDTLLLKAIQDKKENIVKLLLQLNADVKVQNSSGYTPLHYAAMYGYKDLVVQFLGYGVDINKKTEDDFNTALLLALRGKHIEVAKLLILSMAEVNVINKDKCNCLHYGAMYGDIPLVQDLIAAGEELNLQNADGFTPLQLAIGNDKLDIIKLLLSYDVDKTLKTESKNSTLHIAASAGNNEIIQICLEDNFDINEINRLGRTPILCALQGRKFETARFLIKKGANIRIKDNFLNSALHYVARCGQDDLVVLFLEEGFNVNQKNLHGDTAFSLALLNCHLSTAKLLQSKGSEIDIKNSDRSTTLHLAASCGYNELIMECLDKGYDINAANFDCNLPIDFAIMENKFETVKLLIEQGSIPSLLTFNLYADMKVQSDFDVEEKIKYFKLLLDKFNNINLSDREGNTILHYVCNSDFGNYNESEINYRKNFYTKSVEVLVELGANFETKNKQYKSGYDLASEKHLEMILQIFDKRKLNKGQLM